MWLARFSPDKGPHLAIEACRAAGVPLVLAGKCNEPNESTYLSEVIRPMLGDGVDLLVNSDRATAMQRLSRARCLLLPITWREPFGMVMIEAMARGVPVVALRRGAVEEIVHHGRTGFICDTPEDLVDALKRVPELDRADCVDHVRRTFSAEVMADRYVEVYLRAMAGQSRSVVSWHPPAPAAAVETRTGAGRRLSGLTWR